MMEILWIVTKKAHSYVLLQLHCQETITRNFGEYNEGNVTSLLICGSYISFTQTDLRQNHHFCQLYKIPAGMKKQFQVLFADIRLAMGGLELATSYSAVN